MASLTQRTWVWVNSRSWWWTRRPGMLPSMGLQRVGHDWATELNWWSFGIWSKLERWKSSVSECRTSWPKITLVVLKWCLLLLCATMNHFSIGLWHATESGFYTTTGDDQFSGWTKKKLQSTSQGQIYTKKRSQSLFGGLLPIWSTIAFWILTKPLDLRSMLRKLMRCIENCNVCSRHWSTERVQSYFMTVPDHTLHSHASTVERIGLQTFASSIIFTWPLANDLSLKHLNNFLGGKCFHNRMRKMLSKNSSNPEAWIFML